MKIEIFSVGENFFSSRINENVREGVIISGEEVDSFSFLVDRKYFKQGLRFFQSSWDVSGVFWRLRFFRELKKFP